MMRFVIIAALACATACTSIKTPYVMSEITSYGEIKNRSSRQKLGVVYGLHDDKKIPVEEQMTLNQISQKIFDESVKRGFESYFIKGEDDLKKFDSGLIVYPSFSVEKDTDYVPIQIHQYTVPSTNYMSGTVSGVSGSYNYSGTYTAPQTEAYTSGGYFIKRNCRTLYLNYVGTDDFQEDKINVSYLQKIESCGKSDDIRSVLNEMLASGFNKFGLEGKFNETIYDYSKTTEEYDPDKTMFLVLEGFLGILLLFALSIPSP